MYGNMTDYEIMMQYNDFNEGCVMKYKIGDLVSYKTHEAVIKKVVKTPSGRYSYEVEFKVEPPYCPHILMEDDLSFIGKKISANCGCGANHQKGFEDFHAVWCAKFKDRS